LSIGSDKLAALSASGYIAPMTRDTVIAILRAHEAPLRRRGVLRAALFGSTARNEATSSSDLDIMVEIDPAARVDVYGYVGITQYIAALFTVPVARRRSWPGWRFRTTPSSHRTS
jgi:uncharacterized protein